MPRRTTISLLLACAALAAGCGGDEGSKPSTSTKRKDAQPAATTPKDRREARSSVELQALAVEAVLAIRACAAKLPGGRTINAATGARCDANGLRSSAPALAADLDTGQLKVQLDPGGVGYLVEASNPDQASSFYVNHPATGAEVRGCQPPGAEGCSRTGTWTKAASTKTGG